MITTGLIISLVVNIFLLVVIVWLLIWCFSNKSDCEVYREEWSKWENRLYSAQGVLIAAAATKVWKIPADQCSAKNHFVINNNNGEKLSYGELASLAATIDVPTKPNMFLSIFGKYGEEVTIEVRDEGNIK